MTMEVWTASWDELPAAGPAALIDVRSPAEFEEYHYPGAVNASLLRDDQRAIIGTIYARVGAESATGRASVFIRERLPELLAVVQRALPEGVTLPVPEAMPLFDAIVERVRSGPGQLESLARPLSEAPESDRPVVHVTCWRGGLRSLSLCLLLSGLGVRAVQLRGGVRAWRKHDLATIAAAELPPLLLIDGMTGAGKTDLLQLIAARRPELVIDLEGLAGHRSSILGDLGLNPVTKKAFDAALAERLRGPLGAPLLLEAESRKIGDVEIPDRLWRAMKAAPAVVLEGRAEVRARRLAEEYWRPERIAPLEPKLEFLAGRMPAEAAERMLTAFRERRPEAVAFELLHGYYDARYKHSSRKRTVLERFNSDDPQRCADELLAWIDADGLAAVRAATP